MFCFSSISNSAKKSNSLQLEFKNKTEILSKSYKELSSFQFYDCLFNGNLERDFLYAQEGQKYQIAKGYDELIDVAMYRNDIYIPMADFFNNCYKRDTLKTIYALIIDLDYLKPVDLKALIKTRISKIKIKPTLLLNSGSGLHLYYVFSAPIECYNQEKKALNDIYTKLQDLFANSQNDGYKLDKHSYIQSYRVCGSLTKLDQLTRGFQSGFKVDIKDLAAWLGVEWKSTVPAQQPKIKLNTTTTNKALTYMPNAKRAFYDHTLSRLPYETPKGNRYMSLFALAIVAWKCRIPRSELEEDITLMVELFNERADNIMSEPVQKAEIKKAMCGYNPKATLVKKETLEEWLGWKFRRNKRNGRTQEEHLDRLAGAKMGISRRRIEKYLKDNYALSISQIAEALDMSRNTVRKYVVLKQGIYHLK